MVQVMRQLENIDVAGVQEAFAAGHEPQGQWYLPEELAEKLPV